MRFSNVKKAFSYYLGNDIGIRFCSVICVPHAVISIVYNLI